MKIGVYNRYWNTFGGGEKYIGSIAQYFMTMGDVDLIAHEPFSIPRLEKRLNLDLRRGRSVILADPSDDAAEELSSDYDLWVTGTFLSPLRSRARRSLLVVMFPFLGGKALKKLWSVAPLPPPSWLQRTVWPRHGFWHTYDVVVALSVYTQAWIRRWWAVDSHILPPPSDLLSCPSREPKKEMIISVGRFFAGGHNKKHGVMIDAFKGLVDAGLCPSWEYHLCGGTHTEPLHQEYLRTVKEKAAGYPVRIHTDISREALNELYCQSSIFWHAAGFGENEWKRPERFEHFGITTVEAMSAGCVPVVIAKAGQKETVNHGVSGYLWETTEELKRYTAELINDRAAAERLGKQARAAAASFSFPAFSNKLDALLRSTIPEFGR